MTPSMEGAFRVFKILEEAVPCIVDTLYIHKHVYREEILYPKEVPGVRISSQEKALSLTVGGFCFFLLILGKIYYKIILVCRIWEKDAKQVQCSLLEMIEKLRQEMYILAEGRSLADPDVIEISQRLDRLLNQYFHLSNQKAATFVA